MGNRAVIKFDGDVSDFGIYLHWNGGVESVKAFCDAAKALGVRDPVSDPTYAAARLTQIIGNWFGGTLSLGAGKSSQLDDSDNGTYTIGRDWQIVERTQGKKTLTPAQRKTYDGILSECIAVNAPIFKGANRD